MTSRAAHCRALLRDRDVLQVTVVAGAACVLSAGLVYMAYFVHVLQVARRSSCEPARGDCVLLFGKHAPTGVPDADFAARLDRAAQLTQAGLAPAWVLLGGGVPGQTTEAELAHAGLRERGLGDAAVHLEAASRDTLQNLCNARELVRQRSIAAGRVVLLSSRYHLARCALFARQLGLDAEVCAAEARLQWTPRTLWRMGVEAGLVCVSDVGICWARLTGNRRMLARVT